MRPYRPIRTTVLLTQAHCQLTASPPATEYITKWQVFKALERRRRTATGLDALPSWFLKLGAPVFSKPLAQLFNLSIAASEVPSQWKQAYIRPVPKVAHPVLNTDFRPISITPVLTRTMERLIVTQFLYPAITYSDISKFSDQYTFRRTGSPTAAIISLLHTVTHLLTDNPYVIVISLDFSKTFDTVRHSALLDKVAQLDMPDEVYD